MQAPGCCRRPLCSASWWSTPRWYTAQPAHMSLADQFSRLPHKRQGEHAWELGTQRSAEPVSKQPAHSCHQLSAIACASDAAT